METDRYEKWVIKARREKHPHRVIFIVIVERVGMYVHLRTCRCAGEGGERSDDPISLRFRLELLGCGALAQCMVVIRALLTGPPRWTRFPETEER